jgi:hypothetical protein
MFFTNKHRKELDSLRQEIDVLKHKTEILKDQIVIQDTRIKALVKAYPNGINKDGSPRKKMGRKVKEQA